MEPAFLFFSSGWGTKKSQCCPTKADLCTTDKKKKRVSCSRSSQVSQVCARDCCVLLVLDDGMCKTEGILVQISPHPWHWEHITRSWVPLLSQQLPCCRYFALPNGSARANFFIYIFYFFEGGLHGCWCQARHVGAELQESLGALLCSSSCSRVPARLSGVFSDRGHLPPTQRACWGRAVQSKARKRLFHSEQQSSSQGLFFGCFHRSGDGWQLIMLCLPAAGAGVHAYATSVRGWDGAGAPGSHYIVALLHVGSAGRRNGIWMGLGVPV